METCDGYAGSILQIDLTTQSVSRLPLSDSYRENLLGGKSLAVQILYDRMTGREKALSEENPVVLASAPLTGSGAPGSARFDLASLSPKDDCPTVSNCGGDFGIRLKQAGYDAMILSGRCREPSWLEISGDSVTFHDAKSLWGLMTGLCRERLKEILKERRFAALCIGPAGENLVEFASVMADGHSTGRAGLGSVLGWKQLKAITMDGDKKIPLHNSAAVQEGNRLWYAQLKKFASEETNAECCTACPLHCERHSRGENPILEELGMDAIAAKAAAKGVEDPEIYKAIAFRRSAGPFPAEGVKTSGEKKGKRRNISHERIRKAFGLEDDGDAFCKNYSEAVCIMGQCMFTVNGLESGTGGSYLLTQINNVTGMQLTLEDLLALGARSRETEQKLRKRFENKTTSAQ